MKECRTCSTVKELISFTSYIDNRNNKQYYRINCKPCENDRLRDYRKISSKKFRADHPSYCSENYKKRKIENPDMCKVSSKKWRIKNPLLNRAKKSRERVQKLKATPLWLTVEQKRDILNVYKNCPSGYHVDHIVPLKGKIVSGLHVSWNLQYLTPQQNLIKSNKL
jgi:hypothetical protein